MAESLIPIGIPGTKWELQPNEIKCLVWYILSGCDRVDAYKAFVHPEMMPKVLSLYCDQFFAMAQTRDFVTQYKEHIKAFLHRKQNGAVKEKENSEEKIKRSSIVLKNKVADAIDNAETLDQVDTAVKLADKMGILEETQETVISPQRYLPETCSRCRYKAFVEENIKQGNIADDDDD
jgi:hypothetical protein